jgi:hypothetical protein
VPFGDEQDLIRFMDNPWMSMDYTWISIDYPWVIHAYPMDIHGSSFHIHGSSMDVREAVAFDLYSFAYQNPGFPPWGLNFDD